ncbi:MAG: FecR domain-containing protein [Pseudobacter sp.]|uniref:FecR domain-containing protein n=1 Tax=Pseudobacter sp. TaxID=2045420 RepID=UPI003F7D5B2C
MNYLDLLPKFAAGTATASEREAFNEWLNSLSPEAFREVLAQYEALLVTQQQNGPHNELLLQSILRQIDGETAATPATLRTMNVRRWIPYAAAITIMIGIGAWWAMSRQQQAVTPVTATTPAAMPDLPPGKEGALLTLADGRTIVLDSLAPGAISADSNNRIMLKQGSLDYAHWQQANSNATTQYNTMQTPRGRQFQLTLPDGTRVWLNAMSSIRFPVSFPGNSREVSISGEAYLEVEKDAARPFIVHSNGITTEVLGTAFNVNAYGDEDATRITLINGKVVVRNAEQSSTLKPGTQATCNKKEIRQAEVDADQAIAWKNGIFNFHQTSLQSAMRQIARWYDVEIEYGNNVPAITFAGKIQRNLSLKQILKGLEDEQVHFTIEGKKLIVTK